MVTKEDIITVYFSNLETDHISWVGYKRNSTKEDQTARKGEPREVWHQRGYSGEYGVKKYFGAQIDNSYYNKGGDRGKPDAYLPNGTTVSIKTKSRDSSLYISPDSIKKCQITILCWYSIELDKTQIVGWINNSELIKVAKIVKNEYNLSWKELRPIKELITSPYITQEKGECQ